MKAILVYVTVPSIDEGERLARAIVEDRFAACANIFPEMKSIYHWDGEIKEDSEVVLIFKTRAELFPALEERVKELHSYKTPCIVSLPVTEGSNEFMQWILKETKP